MRKAIVAVLSVTAFATSMFAQSKPNFSGTWKLNVTKSDFGPVPAPDTRTDVIDHSDPALKVSTSVTGGPQGNMEATSNYTTDGKEATNHMGPREVKATVVWDGPKLVVNAKTTYQEAELGIKSIWILSDDGKTLTQNVHFTTPMGEADQTLIYDKQDAGAATAAAPAKATPPPVVGAPASGGAKPNFSGTWKLDVSKSDFGVLPPDNSRTYVIDHSDPVLKIAVSADTAQGKQDFTLSFTTDGKEVTNNAGGLELKSILTWESSTLVDNTKLKFQDQDVAIKEIWLLSDDGKTLTQNAHYTSTMGEMDTKFVYVKATP
jgi:hypothetical protein